MPDFPAPSVPAARIPRQAWEGAMAWHSTISFDELGATYWAMASNGGAFGSPGWTAASVTYVFDSTEQVWYGRNNTGGNSTIVMVADSLGNATMLTGPGGGFDVHGFDMKGGAIPIGPETARTIFVVEIRAAIRVTDASRPTTYTGVGLRLNNSSNPWETSGTQEWVQLYRHSTNGWQVATRDGSTISEAAESSPTDDGDPHIFRFELEQVAAVDTLRVYVDGTLVITKTTNIPDLDDGALGSGGCDAVVGADTAESDDSMRTYAMTAYWK